MVADAGDDADPWLYLRVRHRVRGPRHAPLHAPEVAVRELRLVDVDHVYTGSEQFDHRERKLLSQDEVAVPVSGEWDALDLLIPHLELLPEHLPDVVQGDVLSTRAFYYLQDLIRVVDFTSGREDIVDSGLNKFTSSDASSSYSIKFCKYLESFLTRLIIVLTAQTFT